MSRKATDPVTTISIDIGKNSLHPIGLDSVRSIGLRQMLSRCHVQVPLYGDGR